VDRALWLLLWLRLKGWLRRLLRSTHTARGLLLLIAGVLFFGCIFLNPIVNYFLHPARTGNSEVVEHMRTYGALGLLAYCAMTLLFSSGERAIFFSPAEVNFLFPGPFTRRRLLVYKITSSVLACLVTSGFMTLALSTYGVWPLAAYVGLVLTLLFLSFFGMVISLAANTLGARAYNRRRKWLLAGVLLVVLLALALEGRDLLRLRPAEMLERLQESPVAQVVLAPLGWFVRAYTAADAGELLRFGGLALAVDAAMAALVLALDVQYLEASAAASERVYARILRARRVGAPSAAWYTPGGKARFTLPPLPWWGGVGPLAWRQLLTAVRSLKGLTIFLALIGGALLVVPLVVAAGDRSAELAVGQILAYSLLGLSLISLPMMVAFDFRGDVDRMDILKALPVAPWRVVVGQLAAPVLLLSLIQVLALVGIEVAFGGIAPLPLVALVLAWPVNFVSLGIDNLLFLWFPSRQVVAMPHDFQVMGRQLLLLVAKGMALGSAVVSAALAYALVWFLGHSLPGALAAAFLVLAACGAALVPLLAFAFARFDVARDTPP
jgi:hypothetical protein